MNGDFGFPLVLLAHGLPDPVLLLVLLPVHEDNLPRGEVAVGRDPRDRFYQRRSDSSQAHDHRLIKHPRMPSKKRSKKIIHRTGAWIMLMGGVPQGASLRTFAHRILQRDDVGKPLLVIPGVTLKEDPGPMGDHVRNGRDHLVIGDGLLTFCAGNV
jgi:hypothetical protein